MKGSLIQAKMNRDWNLKRQLNLKIVYYLTLVAIFLIPFLPLVVSGSLIYPFITGKNFLFRIIVETILGLWIILALFDKTYRLQKSWLLIALVSFIIVFSLSVFFGANPSRSFWSNFERMEGLLTYLHLFGFFVVLSCVMKTQTLWDCFFQTSLGISLVVAIHGLFQLVGKLAILQNEFRIDATLGNAPFLAIYMVFHLFLALIYLLRSKTRYRWFYLPLILVHTIVIYYTATRGSILALLTGMVLAIFLMLLNQNKTRKHTIVFLISVVVLISGLWIHKNSAFIQESPVLSRFAHISLNEQTTQSRLVIWKMSLDAFKEKPFLGWGADNFNLIFEKYYQPILWRQEPWFDRAHNVIMDRLISSGILGLITYLGLFLSVFYYLWFKREESRLLTSETILLTAMFSAYFFHNLFHFDSITSLILFFSFLAYIQSRITMRVVSEPCKPDKSGQKIFVAIIVGVMTITMIYFVNVPGIMVANIIVKATKEWMQNEDYESAVEQYEKAISYNSFGSAEAREQLVRFVTQVIQLPNVKQEIKNNLLAIAISEGKKQIDISPSDVRPRFVLGTLYNKSRLFDEAISELNNCIKLSPKKQQLYFEIADSYFEKKDSDKLYKILKTAYEIEPSNLKARQYYASATILIGNVADGAKLMQDYGGTASLSKRFRVISRQ